MLLTLIVIFANLPFISSENWTPTSGTNANKWTHIVVHHSATSTGNAKIFDTYHRSKGWDELGYHFVIGNGSQSEDGEIEVGSRWTKQKHGAHCKTDDNYYNDHGIGICLVGNFETGSPSAKQIESLKKLIIFLQKECSIKNQQVQTHSEIGQTACSGKHLSGDKVRYLLRDVQ